MKVVKTTILSGVGKLGASIYVKTDHTTPTIPNALTTLESIPLFYNIHPEGPICLTGHRDYD